MRYWYLSLSLSPTPQLRPTEFGFAAQTLYNIATSVSIYIEILLF